MICLFLSLFCCFTTNCRPTCHKTPTTCPAGLNSDGNGHCYPQEAA
jgi:hypothetical protein